MGVIPEVNDALSALTFDDVDVEVVPGGCCTTRVRLTMPYGDGKTCYLECEFSNTMVLRMLKRGGSELRDVVGKRVEELKFHVLGLQKLGSQISPSPKPESP